MPVAHNLPWLGAAAVLCGTLLVGCGEPPEAHALSDVIRGAETAELNLENFPASYRQDGDGTLVQQAMLDAVQPSLSRYFTGSLLGKKVSLEQRALRGALAARAGGRIGGVSSLSISDVQVTGTSAHARARVTLWFKSAQFWYQDPRAFNSATNILDLDLHFTRIAASWKIDAETSRFAPGGGP